MDWTADREYLCRCSSRHCDGRTAFLPDLSAHSFPNTQLARVLWPKEVPRAHV